MFKWFLLALCMFAGVNWFLIPHYPEVTQWIHPLTIWSAIGLSGLLMLVGMVLGGKHK